MATTPFQYSAITGTDRMPNLNKDQINKILTARPDVAANVTQNGKVDYGKAQRWYEGYGVMDQNIANVLGGQAAPAAAPVAAPAVAALAPAAPATAVDPYAFLTGAAGATKSLSDMLGITDLQTQMSGLDTTIADKKAKLNEALGTVNENPWLAEASRLGRAKRLQEMANLDIGNVTEQKGLLNDKLGYLTNQMGNVISLGNSQQQNQLQRDQMATSSAEFASQMELEKAKMNQNDKQFQQNILFDSAKFSKQLGLDKAEAKRLATQYNTNLKLQYAQLTETSANNAAGNALNAEQFDWKKIYDASYLEHLKNTEKSGGSFGDL